MIPIEHKIVTYILKLGSICPKELVERMLDEKEEEIRGAIWWMLERGEVFITYDRKIAVSKKGVSKEWQLSGRR